MSKHSTGVVAALAKFQAKVARGDVPEPKLRPARRRRPTHPREDDEQAIVCQWLKANGILYFAVPNGAHLAGRSHQERSIQWGKLRRIGAQPGVPDLVVLMSHVIGGPVVFLEMKRVLAAKPVVSPQQEQWHDALRERGFNVLVGYGAGDAIAKLQSYAADDTIAELAVEADR